MPQGARDLLVEQAAAGGEGDQDLARPPKSRIKIPSKRRIALYAMAAMNGICLVLIIMSTLNPVPVFKQDQGLLRVSASYPNASDALNFPRNGRRGFVLPLTTSSNSADDLLDKRTRVVTEFWDEGCACLRTITQTVHETQRSTKTRHHTVFVDPTMKKIVPSSSIKHPHHPTSKDTTRYGTTTCTTTTATSTITPKSRTAKPTKKPVEPPTEAQSAVMVDPGAFAALYLGVTGGCVQRRSGVLVCTSSSFSPNFLEIYAETGLASNVTAQMPANTGGGSIGVLVAIIFYVFTVLAFILALVPGAWIYGPSTVGRGKGPDLRHAWTQVFATAMAAVSTFAIVASAIQLQNTFGGAAEAVVAWDKSRTLSAKLLTTYGYLYACAILSGLTVVVSLGLIAWDFHSPWWMTFTRKNKNLFTQQVEASHREGTSARTGPGTSQWASGGGSVVSGVSGRGGGGREYVPQAPMMLGPAQPMAGDMGGGQWGPPPGSVIGGYNRGGPYR